MRKEFETPSMYISMFDDEVHTQNMQLLSAKGYTAGQHVEGQMFEGNNKRMAVYTVKLQNALEFSN